jgi:hypothetical protein
MLTENLSGLRALLMPHDLNIELNSISAANILAYVVDSNVSHLSDICVLTRFTHCTVRICNRELTSGKAPE